MLPEIELLFGSVLVRSSTLPERRLLKFEFIANTLEEDNEKFEQLKAEIRIAGAIVRNTTKYGNLKFELRNLDQVPPEGRDVIENKF